MKGRGGEGERKKGEESEREKRNGGRDREGGKKRGRKEEWEEGEKGEREGRGTEKKGERHSKKERREKVNCLWKAGEFQLMYTGKYTTVLKISYR